MKAKKFEQQFDDGADITASLDLSKARRVLQATTSHVTLQQTPKIATQR